MDLHALEYYKAYSDQIPHGHFHAVIPLHSSPQLGWSEVSSIISDLPKGWHELAQLSVSDRIGFTRDFWLSKLPYQPDLTENLSKFFSSIDDIGIYLTQQQFSDPYKVHLVYSLSDNGGFFHGEAPASEQAIRQLQKDFADYTLPADYVAFLQIHNGFAKLTDTGITPAEKMKEKYENFKIVVESNPEPIMTDTGVMVNPASLIPFYESFGQPFFQCFWADWYPDQEMGNIYYSAFSRTFKNCAKKEEYVETMAFETFTDWLFFYLEKVN